MDETTAGFTLYSDDQSWEGGIGIAVSWEVIEDDDPRITVQHREALGYLFR